jgi:hypothetical protein
MLSSLLRPGQTLEKVHYFTAPVVGDGWPRQDAYLRALQAHSPEVVVHLGRYMAKTAQCRDCGARWTTYEEKESDVAFAVRLAQDAGLRMFDLALIVSADSDMCPAVRAARTLAPQARYVAVFPPRRSSMNLARHVDATLRIFDRVPRRFQLPDVVTDPHGRELVRPRYWA